MRDANELPTVAQLRLLLRYDQKTGKLFWKQRARELFSSDGSWKTWNTRFAGKEALTASIGGKSGYLHGHVLGVKLRAHRVIWAFVTGDWPVQEIDHINGNPQDNRFENLRCVEHSENNRNLSMPVTNTSGVVGVSWSNARGRWVAQIWDRGRHRGLGRFVRFEDAVKARKSAEKALNYHENHGRAR
jgi:hypothetical protein